jgi:hypothetical protein
MMDNAKEWKQDIIYPQGTILLYKGKLFQAQAKENSCRPNSGFLSMILYVGLI